MNFFARRASSAFAWAAICFAASAGGVLLSSEPAQAIRPAYTTTNRLGNYAPPGVTESAYGFYFDVTFNGLEIDALGFAPQEGWPGGTSSYTVTLWKFENGGNAPGDYTELASSIFTPGNPYVIQDGYCWESIVPVVLPETYNSDPTDQRGYVIAAIGDFRNSPGNVQYESGIPNIDPNFNFGGNGFNNDNTNAFWPVPGGDAGLGINAFFNPNLSYVPGPAPILGLGVSFGIARKLRQRIKSAT
jgi:hypothetical protein